LGRAGTQGDEGLTGPSHSTSTASIAKARAALAARLEARRPEIEDAVLARVYAVAGPAGIADTEYADGLRAAVAEALTYGLATVESGEERLPSPPPAPLAQARLAASQGVNLDTVLRRYFAGHTLVADFLVEEAKRSGLLAGAELQRLLRAQVTLFDRLVAAVSKEYRREAEGRPGSAEERRTEIVKRLLAGELLGTAELAYPLDATHVGAVARGKGAAEALRELAGALDRRLLLVPSGEETVWAWLGGRRPPDPERLDRLLHATWPATASLAIGEPGEGFRGWRFTHRQALGALPIALRSSDPYVRYDDVALLASALQDDLLVTSLRQLYLAPLEDERDGGEIARETLRAYFAAERNASSAAALLGVSRQAVNNRLRAIERLLGRPLGDCAAELETALRLESTDVNAGDGLHVTLMQHHTVSTWESGSY
jgi:hypothetical protein